MANNEQTLGDLREQEAAHQSLGLRRVRRPRTGWMGLMVRGLGQIPSDTVPSQHEFQNVRRYRLLAVAAVIATLVIITASVSMLPILRISPVSVSAQAIGGDGSGTTFMRILSALICTGVLLFFCVLGPRKVYAFLFSAALSEEIAFRFGAEEWSAKQRIRSCAQFGLAHLMNLIVPIIALITITLVGGGCMWVYLREVKRTGDRRKALVSATHFHATYNVTILVVGVIVTGLFFLAPMLS